MKEGRTLEIDGLRIVEDNVDHGTWMVFSPDGLRLAMTVRRVDELYDVIDRWRKGELRGVIHHEPERKGQDG